MTRGPDSPIEQAALAASESHARHYGYLPTPWRRMTPDEHASWIKVAETSIATYLIARRKQRAAS